MPTPAWNPVRPPSCSSWSAIIPGLHAVKSTCSKGVVGWPATLANLAAASPARLLRSVAGPRHLSASVESAAPPSLEELRQVVPVSDMRGRLGAGPARCRWRAATGYQPRPPAARCLGANRRTPCCRQPPKQARGSVDNMRILSTYRPPRLGHSPTWNSHSTVPHSLHRSPARRSTGHGHGDRRTSPCYLSICRPVAGAYYLHM
jgi:hypothetical protein